MSPTGALPFVGHAPWFLFDKLGFLESCARNARGPVWLHIGGPTLLLTSPDDVRHVLVDNGRNYDKSPRLREARGQRLSGSGLQTKFGADHLRQRRMLQPAFRRTGMDRFFAMMSARTEAHIRLWQDGVELDVADETERLALSILIAALFGERFDDGGAFAQAITIRRAYLEHMYGSVFPRPEYLPVPVVIRYQPAIRLIEQTFSRAIEGEPAEPWTFQAMLRDLEYADGSRMSSEEIRHEFLSLSSTGYETVGEGLAWTLYALARHPEVEAKLVSELQNAGTLTGESLGQLRYLRMVIEESLRLYPPTWIFVRMALGDDRLPSGTTVPNGTKIYLCPWTMHRDPRWFPDPERFDPERFDEEAKSRRPKFTWFPLGGGPRVCLGEHFAMQEMMLVLATVLPRFHFELVPGQDIRFRPTITLRSKNGIRMRIHGR